MAPKAAMQLADENANDQLYYIRHKIGT